MAGLLFIEVPTEMVQKATHLSLDFGSSVIKTASLQKDTSFERNLSPKSRIILKGFSREDMDAGTRKDNRTLLQEIKGHFGEHGVFDMKTDTKAPIYTTGVGVSQMLIEVQDVFQTSVSNLNEMQCAVKALLSLGKYLCEDEMCLPVPKLAPRPPGMTNPADSFSYAPEGSKTHKYVQKCEEMKICSTDLEATFDEVRKPLINAETNDSLFPALFVICGSAIVGLRVESDGSFQFVLSSAVAGHTLLGMSSLLTGIMNFEEIDNLASQGDANQLNIHLRDVLPPQKSGDTYQSLLTANPDILCFAFSKAYKKTLDDFRKEDILKSYMEGFADTMTVISYSTAMAHGCKSVFFGGGMCNSASLRGYISNMFEGRNRRFLNSTGHDMKLYFPKHAQYFGAIGALLLAADNV